MDRNYDAIMDAAADDELRTYEQSVLRDAVRHLSHLINIGMSTVTRFELRKRGFSGSVEDDLVRNGFLITLVGGEDVSDRFAFYGINSRAVSFEMKSAAAGNNHQTVLEL